MARSIQPNLPYNVAMKLLKPTDDMVKGVKKKVYPNPEDVSEVFFGTFRTYGGTENMSNGVYTVFDTAVVETWYNPNITTDCKVFVCDTGESYDVKTRPEDMGMRHQFMQFKVEKVGGKT